MSAEGWRRASARIARRVARCAQLAMLLEVSAYPKPGNVHRLRDFRETRYEHFLVSSCVAADYFRAAAIRGLKASVGLLDFSEIGVGRLIEACMREVIREQRGGNTCLGTVTMLMPLSAASALTMLEGGDMYGDLRANLSLVLRSTTPRDAVAFYNAIKVAKPNIGRSKWLDAFDESSKRVILERGITLYQIFEYASKYDTVAREWVTDFEVTFKLGAPYMQKLLDEGYDINAAIVHTFLKILSEIPDTLIVKKAGLEKALEVSRMAREVLEAGGLRTQEGRRLLADMDFKLREEDHLLNPGTTADITAASIMLVLLRGMKF